MIGDLVIAHSCSEAVSGLCRRPVGMAGHNSCHLDDERINELMTLLAFIPPPLSLTLLKHFKDRI